MADGSEKNLDELSVTELRERAAELEITGRSSMNREDLLQSVKDAEEQTAFLQADGDGGSSTGSEDEEDAVNEWLPRTESPAPDAHAASDTDTDDTGSDADEESNAEDASSADDGSSAANGSSADRDSGADSESGSDADDGSSNAEDSESASDDGEEDASDITAPSIGPNTTIEHVPPDERLDMDKISDVDAMGLDKRRQVGGQRYGASPAKQAAIYGGAIAILVAIVIGAKLLADELDQPPAVQEDKAPWADAEQKEPAPIDFPRSTEQ